MSRLDDAMSQYMAQIVFQERRPFDYRDFLTFKIDHVTYKMSHGTFRNKISILQRKGEVKIAYYSGLGFYTLTGYDFSKPMTIDHTLVHNNPIYKFLQDLPLGQQSIHDIRLKFKVPNIWEIISFSNNFPKNKRSKDIAIPSWNKDNTIVKVFIHKSDSVSVIIGCSLCPIPLNAEGIILFFTLLTRVEERLKTILDPDSCVYNEESSHSIPDYRQWIVTMWHFGRDSLTKYYGDKFFITVEKMQGILISMYAKDMKNGVRRIRLERQEYPRKTIMDAIEEKLG